MRSAAFSNRSHNDWHKPASTDGAFSDLICGAQGQNRQNARDRTTYAPGHNAKTQIRRRLSRVQSHSGSPLRSGSLSRIRSIIRARRVSD